MEISTLLIVLLALYFISKILKSSEQNGTFVPLESFGCPKKASVMCHQIAASQCQIPTYTLNDCWLNAYSSCQKNCLKGRQGMCDCDNYARSRCKSSTDPADACYSSVSQKCMAGMGFACDPDRCS